MGRGKVEGKERSGGKVRGRGKRWGGKGDGRVGEGSKEVAWRGIEDCAVLKIPLKSPGARPTLTLRQIDAPVQGLVYAFWALLHDYF